MTAAAWVLLIAGIGFTWPFIWYPLVLRLFTKQAFHFSHPTDELPVTIIIPCHNEAGVITRKLSDTVQHLGQRRSQILVADDGSTDTTKVLAEQFASQHPQVEVHHFDRLGKAGVINHAWSLAKFEVVVITDANASLDPQAMTHLLTPFSDATIGEVRGRFLPLSSEDINTHHGTAQYQDLSHQTFLAESERGMLHVAGGALQAFRKSAHRPSSSMTMTEDWDMTLEVRSQGLFVVYAPAAIAYKRVTVRNDELWHQQVRLVYGTLQTAWKYRRVANPFRYGRLSLAFLSGKPAQIFGPWWLLIMTIAIALLARTYQAAWIALITIAAIVALGFITLAVNLRQRRVNLVISHFLEYAILTEAGAVWAWILWLIRGGKNWSGWKPAQSVR